jgi:hypothetical protein
MRHARLTHRSPLLPLNAVANGLLGLLMGLCLCLAMAHTASAEPASPQNPTQVPTTREQALIVVPPAKLFLVSTLYPYEPLTRRSQSPYALTQFQALLGQALAKQQEGQLSLTPNRETADYIVTLTCSGLRPCSRYQLAVAEAATHQTVVTFMLSGSWLPWGKPPVERDSQQLAKGLYHWLGQVTLGRGGAYD